MEQKIDEQKAKWTQDGQHNVHGIHGYDAAKLVKTTTEATLKHNGQKDYKLKIRLRSSGLFDVLVFRPIARVQDSK